MVRLALISFLVGCSFGQTQFTCWECQDGFGVAADNAKCRDKKPDGNKVNVKKCEYGCAFLTYKMDSNIGGITDSDDAIKRTCYSETDTESLWDLYGQSGYKDKSGCFKIEQLLKEKVTLKPVIRFASLKSATRVTAPG